MTVPKTYSCGICKTQPDQISHHKTHILTQKHKDKYELFELKLSKLSEKLQAKLTNMSRPAIRTISEEKKLKKYENNN